MPFPYENLRSGLVGAWCPSLGATGYTLLDRSGRNNHGTLTNMGGQGNWQAGSNGLSLNFDGSNDYAPATVDASYQLGSFSWSLWVRRSGNVTQNYPGVAAHTNFINASFFLPGPAVLLIPSSGGSIANKGLYFQCQNTTQTMSAMEVVAGNDGLFHSYCGVVDGAAISLYKDGVLQDSYPVITRATVTRAFEIGRRSGNSAGTSFEYFSGQIDDFRIYNRALTPSEIRILATRPGIGLVPQGRSAGLPRRLSVNVGGTWRSADAFVNVGGTWKWAYPQVNVSGAWK